ncbi:NUDIX domain-containing protein [Streptomyces adustus]|uniref:NUDIX domain-containing protein n=1 Tax=Streptomyces adustus TaxID=1609272 RepID=UPI00371F5ACD
MDIDVAGQCLLPGEDPWAAVVRGCRKELGIHATASPITGELPLFLTATETRGQGTHTDVSLWYLLTADADTITSYDQDEFNAIRWMTDEQVLREPDKLLDPHMHRFTHKLQHTRTGRHRGGLVLRLSGREGVDRGLPRVGVRIAMLGPVRGVHGVRVVAAPTAGR